MFESNSFIPFVTAGHPDLETTRDLILKLAEIGSDLVEIGIPFSDPIADGPVIQKSSFQALQHGYSMEDYLDLVRQIRAESDVKLIFMTYMNPVFRYGVERLDRKAAEVGLDGILISDLTPEEVTDHFELKHLQTVFLVAPTSSEERIVRICRAATGFVYLVARTGVTGKQTALSSRLEATAARIRECTDRPIGVGFGIRSRADVRRVWKIAEGAIVGSAIVKFIEDHKEEEDLVERVGRYVADEILPPRKSQ